MPLLSRPGTATAEPGGVIFVEVVYAGPARAWRVCLELERGATAQDAVRRSGILEQLRLRLDALGLGVHGRLCRPDHVLRDGDRVELYRPLEASPMEARRRRARS